MENMIKNIDYYATLCVAEAEEMFNWIPIPDAYHNKLNSEGNVLESSLILGKDTDTVVEITRQIPLGFYIDNEGVCIKSNAPTVPPFKITVYYPCDGLKTVYKVTEVEKEVLFDEKELEVETWKNIRYEE